MESWDDEDFEPNRVDPTHHVLPTNKWEGEDEDDEVKENWEDEDEEKDKEQKLEERAVSKSKKKSLVEKLAEKERLKREEYEKRAKEQQEEETSAEEKLRRQKESDLKIALETTFGDTEKIAAGLDGLTPETKEQFQEFADVIMKKVQPFCKSAEFPTFAENLIRNLCATLTSLDIKKIKTTIDNLYLEKQKIEKGDKAKKNKGKGKAKLKMEDENQFSAYVGDDYNDYDDFM